MPALTPEQKIFVVTRLACHDTPGMVLDAWKEEFPGKPLPSRQQVVTYDPDNRVGRNLSKELVKLFRDTRKKFLKEWQAIPIAQKAVRLSLLNSMTMTAVQKKNIGMAAQLMEQAAKEAGEAFTNRHHVNVKGKMEVTPGMPAQQLVDRLAKYGITATLPGTTPAKPGEGGDAGG